MNEPIRATTKFNLKQLLEKLVTAEPNITEVYVFGSRAYCTESLRSDCDLIVRVAAGLNVKSSNLRDFANENCAALDFFLCADSRAVSCANDSYVYGSSFEELIDKLDAVLLWNRDQGFEKFGFRDSGNWVFETSMNANFAVTTLPDAHVSQQAWHQKIRAVEIEGLPVRPFIGDTLQKCVVQISDVIRNMIFEPLQLGQRGVAKQGWTVNLKSEYDCQNLFYSVVKPWLPALGREEVAIIYDDQKKIVGLFAFQRQINH